MILKITISILCLSLSAMFNAIMDISEFKPHRFKRIWWRHDWTRKYINNDPAQGRIKWFGNVNKPVQIIDGFHFSKMMLVICLSTALIVLASSVWWHWLIGYAICYIVWNGTFVLFYKYWL